MWVIKVSELGFESGRCWVGNSVRCVDAFINTFQLLLADAGYNALLMVQAAVGMGG